MISFVILHYKNLDDTLECIESIKGIKTKVKKSIIVVDNNTLTEDEYKKLITKTKDIIRLDTNMGFAKGNNKGCNYAIKKYHPDFLCVINADTIIEQTNFIDMIYELYGKYSFDILGPKIMPEWTESCNPFHVYETKEEIEKSIRYSKKMIKIYSNPLLRNILNIYLMVKKVFKKKINTNGTEEITSVGLHGCALIFSKQYYERFDNIFYPNTFLFHEEEFLYLRSKKYNLVTLYSPKIEIVHKEGQSLSKKFNKKYESLIFRHREIIKSLKLLEEEMDSLEV